MDATSNFGVETDCAKLRDKIVKALTASIPAGLIGTRRIGVDLWPFDGFIKPSFHAYYAKSACLLVVLPIIR
jgi:hypothetical protein